MDEIEQKARFGNWVLGKLVDEDSQNNSAALKEALPAVPRECDHKIMAVVWKKNSSGRDIPFVQCRCGKRGSEIEFGSYGRGEDWLMRYIAQLEERVTELELNVDPSVRRSPDYEAGPDGLGKMVSQLLTVERSLYDDLDEPEFRDIREAIDSLNKIRRLYSTKTFSSNEHANIEGDVRKKVCRLLRKLSRKLG